MPLHGGKHLNGGRLAAPSERTPASRSCRRRFRDARQQEWRGRGGGDEPQHCDQAHGRGRSGRGGPRTPAPTRRRAKAFGRELARPARSTRRSGTPRDSRQPDPVGVRTAVGKGLGAGGDERHAFLLRTGRHHHIRRISRTASGRGRARRVQGQRRPKLRRSWRSLVSAHSGPTPGGGAGPRPTPAALSPARRIAQE